MTFRPSSPRARPRWLVLIGIVTLLTGTLGSATLAFNPGPGTGSLSPFNAGDAAPDCPPGTPDLNTAVDASTAGDITSVTCTETDGSLSKSVTVRWIADTVSGSATDNAWGQGDKSDCYRAKQGGVHGACVTQVTGIGAAKTDLQYHGISLEKGLAGTGTGATHDFLYSGIKRLQAGGVTSSNANYNVEVNQLLPAYQPAAPICPLPAGEEGECNMWRSPGDLTFMTDWGGQNSSCDTPTPAICAYVWIDTSTGTGAGGITKTPNTGTCFTKTNVPPCWGLPPGGDAALSANPDKAAGSINSGAAVQPFTFSEIGIDLTASGLVPAGSCAVFQNVWAHSRSSSSFTAELKDFIFGAVNISTCTTTTTELHQRTNSTGNVDVSPANNGASISVPLGSWVNDIATVTPSSATGNVKFKYYTSTALCTADTDGTSSGTGITTVSTNALSGGTATSSTIQVNTVGTFYWRAFYLGGNLSPSSSACGVEVLTVTQVDTAISTATWYYPNDTATVTAPNGGGTPTGSVKFRLYDSQANCQATTPSDTVGTGGLLYKQTVSLPASSPFTVSTSNTTVAVSTSGSVWWLVEFTSTNTSQKGRNSVCVENINATLTNEAGPGTAGNTPTVP